MTTDSPRGLPPQLDIDGAIATITLRRPDVANRLELSDLEQLRQQLAESMPRRRAGAAIARHGTPFLQRLQYREVGGSEAGARFRRSLRRWRRPAL